MENIRGPAVAKRRLLQSVIQSQLLYAAPVWAEATKKYKYNRVLLLRAQRLSTIRTIRGYRTISRAVALMLAEMAKDRMDSSEDTRT